MSDDDEELGLSKVTISFSREMCVWRDKDDGKGGFEKITGDDKYLMEVEFGKRVYTQEKCGDDITLSLESIDDYNIEFRLRSGVEKNIIGCCELDLEENISGEDWIRDFNYGPITQIITDSSQQKIRFGLFLRFSNIGISVEEACPLHPLMSNNYHFDPILCIISTYLPFSFAIRKLCLVSKHVRNIILSSKTIIKFDHMKSPKIEKSEYLVRHVSSSVENLWINFRNNVLNPGLRTRSLDLDGYFALTALEYTSYTSPDDLSFSFDFNDRYENKSWSSANLDFSLCDFTLFRNLFINLEVLKITGIQTFDFITSFLNQIPSLKHFEVSAIDKTLKPKIALKKHENLEIFRVQSVYPCFFENAYHYSEDEVLEEFYLCLFQQCKNLQYTEVPCIWIWGTIVGRPKEETKSIKYLKQQYIQRNREINEEKEDNLILFDHEGIELDFFGSTVNTCTKGCFRFDRSLNRISHIQAKLLVIKGYPLLLRASKYLNEQRTKEVFSGFYFYSLLENQPIKLGLRYFYDTEYLKKKEKKKKEEEEEEDLWKKRPGFALKYIDSDTTKQLGVRENRNEISFSTRVIAEDDEVNDENLFYNQKGVPSNLRLLEIQIRKKYLSMKEHDDEIERFTKIIPKLRKSLASKRVLERKEFEKRIDELREKKKIIPQLPIPKNDEIRTSRLKFNVTLKKDFKESRVLRNNEFFTCFGDFIAWYFSVDCWVSTKRLSFYLTRMKDLCEDWVIPVCYNVTLNFKNNTSISEINNQLKNEEEDEEEDDHSKNNMMISRFQSCVNYYTSEDLGWGFASIILPDQFYEDIETNEGDDESRNAKIMEVDLEMIICGKILTSTEWIDQHKHFASTFTGNMFEEKILVMEIPHSKSSIQMKGPHFNICGLDFNVEVFPRDVSHTFVHYNDYIKNFNERKKNLKRKKKRKKIEKLKLEFTRVLSDRQLLICGEMTAQVLDENGEENPMFLEKKLEFDGITGAKEMKEKKTTISRFSTCLTFIGLCNRNDRRKIWKFRIKMKLKDVKWIKHEKKEEIMEKKEDEKDNGEEEKKEKKDSEDEKDSGDRGGDERNEN